MATPWVKVPPEVLKAAKRGDWSKLGDFVREEDALVTEAIVDIDGEALGKWTHRLILVLHAVVSGGNSDKFLRSATVVCSKAKHLLLAARDAKGGTPFHWAARSGNVKMLSHLIDLARRDGGDGVGGGGRASRLQVALRKQNDRRETALHEAVRLKDEEMVDLLMSEDAELARFPCDYGASPLYLAILLGHDDIAEQLHDKDSQLSFSGPGGQNALHVAVLRSEGMTKKLLAWNKDLTKKGDLHGRTPLHYAASSGTKKWASLILEADESSAYQSDHTGLFPIHAAAMGNRLVILILLQKCPDCGQLRDYEGRTFLHISASNDRLPFLLTPKHFFGDDACKVRMFASIVNAQDNEGNTALHIAAMAGRPWSMLQLLRTKELELNLQNNKGETARDVWQKVKPSALYLLDPNVRIYHQLSWANAEFGVQQDGEKEKAPARDRLKMEDAIKDTTTVVGVVSVLVITASFAAAFQLPGGYSTGNKPEGTPELANKYSFQAFLVANNLAFFCSAMSIICLMYAGVSFVGITTRLLSSLVSIFFLNSSLRSLLAAFTFGTYAVLAPVAHATTVLAWLSMGLVLVDIAWFTYEIRLDIRVLASRDRCRARSYIILQILMTSILFYALWPYLVIAGFMVYWKICGIK